MRALYLLCVWVHVVAAMTWIGGMAFIVFVLVPALRGGGDGSTAGVRMFHEIGVRFRKVGWVALVALVITGIGNLSFRGISLGDILSGRTFSAGGWGGTLAEKLAVVALVLAISLLHDFWIGPRAVELAESAPGSKERGRFRRAASWAGRVNFMLALVIVALAIQLVR